MQTHFSQKEIKIEPIYPNIADSPGQINMQQFSRHERAVAQAKAAALASEASENKSSRRLAGAPELTAGQVVYSRKEKEKVRDVHPAPMKMAEPPPAFLKDGLISEAEMLRQTSLEEVSAQVRLPALNVAPQAKSRTARMAAIARLQVWLRAWVRRVAGVLSHMRGPMFTRTGRQAMLQLQRLYALVSAGVGDDSMEMVQLRVAFGETYYHMMEASRRNHRRHRGREREDYGAYFDQFLRSAPE